MKQELVQLSRTLAYALRHDPASFGITLDEEGWVPVQDLLAALRHRSAWRNVQEEDFTAIIAQSDKKRYEMQDGKIRAYYGHSVAQKMKREAAIPPAILFHGTTREAAEAIKLDGLRAMNRQYVHLSADRATAWQVALRRTRKPVILEVAALQAHQDGIKFYLGNDMVWLADYVPSEYIQLSIGR
ncbi:MAG TPA: RNA 2'-phosphotransferase [Ktedonosporobacter sp.]|jgi:putative RNA 2'-phosphotransferase|nr:RNA 2'-phosphotransferase [Ktedonosporobacter sp.]